MDFETTVKMKIYETIAETTIAPDAGEVAALLKAPIEEVAAIFQQLYKKRLLVLEPDNEKKIRMAPPFSGIETQHTVEINHKSYFANCAWDTYGIAAALHRDAVIRSKCADCDQSIELEIKDGQSGKEECLIHFAVPAAQWWNDIIYT